MSRKKIKIVHSAYKMQNKHFAWMLNEKVKSDKENVEKNWDEIQEKYLTNYKVG